MTGPSHPEEQGPEPVDDRVIKSQMSVLKSQDLALRVIEALKFRIAPDLIP